MTKKTTTEENRWNEIGQDALKAGRNLWLAGLGAVATVNEKSKIVMADLIDRGERFEKQERNAMSRRWDKAGKELESFGREVKTFGRKLEEGLEDRVSSTMERLGVPSHREVQNLIHRIEDLTKKVETLAVN